MRARFLIWGAVASCACCLAGCESKPLEPDGQEPLSLAEFSTAFAKGFCGALATCCNDQRLAFDEALCRRDAAEVGADLQHETEGLRVTFDPVAAARCIEDWTTVACLPIPRLAFNQKHYCSLVFKGSVLPGQPCAGHEECAGEGAYCNEVCVAAEAKPMNARLGEACGGTCKRPSYAEDGCESLFEAPHDLPSDVDLPSCHTKDGLQCSGLSSATRTCQSLVEVGESCTGNSASCVEGAFCNDTQLCEQQRDSGPCEGNSDPCSDDAFCAETLECVYVGEWSGKACTADADCRDGYCNPFSICQEPYSAEFCADPLSFL
jgi:hypothetical protein